MKNRESLVAFCHLPAKGLNLRGRYRRFATRISQQATGTATGSEDDNQKDYRGDHRNDKSTYWN
ncbi:hypothetical protein LBMAG14_04400 [Actinomycetes bacterium]|nr:hypothetical protein LBMAG14_04400 [Actinomycetes bacterium]